MTTPNVGAQDPELPNSPIAQEALEQDPTLRQEAPEEGYCLFNGEKFADGTVVQSGTAMLRCERGMWVPAGPGDPDNT